MWREQRSHQLNGRLHQIFLEYNFRKTFFNAENVTRGLYRVF